MSPDRTELEWIYVPADLFEAPFEGEYPSFKLSIRDGKAVATVVGGQPDDETEKRIADQVRAAIKVRQLQVHRTTSLEGPTLVEFMGERQNIVLRIRSAEVLVISAGRVDSQMTDAAGRIVADSKADRIAAETEELERIAAKAVPASILLAMLESYVKAIDDPNNELGYMYEVMDALKKHFRGDEAARSALGIGRPEWNRLATLANVEPLEEGRHRGQHSTRRHATADELNDARQIVRTWIAKFADL